VADCKLVDAQTLGQLLLHQFHFVSLLPSNFNLRSELIETTRTAGEAQLPELARSPGRTKADPPRVYCGTSFERPFTVGLSPASDNAIRQVPLRFLVVESTQLAEKEEAALDRKLVKERENPLCQGSCRLSGSLSSGAK
jgi:hypothetical protein